MSVSAEHLLPIEDRARKGQWSPWRAAPPVTASDIRRWAIAVYWPEPAPAHFVEPDAAGSDREEGLIAPQEINPFAWLPGRNASSALPPGVRRLFGGCRIRYGEPIRVGDVIRRRARLEGWTTKTGSSGDFLLADHTHEWRNQHDAMVRDATYTLIYRSSSDASQ